MHSQGAHTRRWLVNQKHIKHEKKTLQTHMHQHAAQDVHQNKKLYIQSAKRQTK